MAREFRRTGSHMRCFSNELKPCCAQVRRYILNEGRSLSPTVNSTFSNVNRTVAGRAYPYFTDSKNNKALRHGSSTLSQPPRQDLRQESRQTFAVVLRIIPTEHR